jgi:hypothetical protein
MLCVLLLLTAFAVLGERLFAATFKLSRDTAEAQNSIATTESALRLLRDDVWSAGKIDVKDAHNVELASGGGSSKTVSWTIKDAAMIRHDASGDDRWTVPAGATFASDGATLSLLTPDSKDAGGIGEIRMASQINVVAKLTQ